MQPFLTPEQTEAILKRVKRHLRWNKNQSKRQFFVFHWPWLSAYDAGCGVWSAFEQALEELTAKPGSYEFCKKSEGLCHYWGGVKLADGWDGNCWHGSFDGEHCPLEADSLIKELDAKWVQPTSVPVKKEEPRHSCGGILHDYQCVKYKGKVYRCGLRCEKCGEWVVSGYVRRWA